MGKKEAQQGPPVEQYRKQIGKSNERRGKKDMKEVTRQAQTKKNAMGIMDILLVLLCFSLTVGAIYGFLYYTLDVKPQQKSELWL